MNNFVQEPGTVRYANAGSAITAGSLVLAGRIAGVAIDNIAATTGSGVLQTRGVVTLPKASSLAISQGDGVFWSGTAVTKTDSDTPIGVAHSAALSAATTVEVLLNVMPLEYVTSDSLAAKASNIGVPFVIERDCSAAAASITLYDANLPRALKIIDVWVECTAANMSGSLKLTNGSADITNAMIMAVGKTIVHAGTIDDAYSTLAAGDTLVATKNDAADKGTVRIMCLPL